MNVRSAEKSVQATAGFKLGATLLTGGTRFALWSPSTQRASVVLFNGEQEIIRTEKLERRGRGYFETFLPTVSEGALYKFSLDDREVIDPYARFLPFGVHGPAQVIGLAGKQKTRGDFVPTPMERAVIYELHVGTFTPAGTWRAAQTKLPYLRELGVSTIEIMPIAAFAGNRGWGYDGVALLAPFAPYGRPEDVRAFIAAAHDLGLSVILDVVLNHFGPDGNYLPSYADEYFTSTHKTAWGDAPNFSDPHLRHLCLEAARTWLVDYELDGLRLDATHAIHDDSDHHILAELSAFASTLKPKKILIAEDERNDPALVTEHGLDAVWADDFHHVMHSVVTGERDGYYQSYEPSASELCRVIRRGWLYEGQIFPTTGEARGKPADGLTSANLIYCLQNHDQVGNRAIGERLHHVTDLEVQAAAAMVLLFLPTVPMLFMGEEWGSSKPFLYFTDHERELGVKITKGRRAEFAHFQAFAKEELREKIPDPQATRTFVDSKLDWAQVEEAEHAALLRIYRTMLTLRANDSVLGTTNETPRCEAVGSLVLLRRSLGSEERTLIFNTSERPERAPFSFFERDILLSSASSAITHEIGGHSAVLLVRNRGA